MLLHMDVMHNFQMNGNGGGPWINEINKLQLLWTTFIKSFGLSEELLTTYLPPMTMSTTHGAIPEIQKFHPQASFVKDSKP